MRAMQRLHRFARATKGLAALEFAILAPMMILLLFGSMEIIDMVLANRRVQNVAASLADVVARDTEVSNDEITGLWSASDVLIYPDDGTNMRLRISSLVVVDDTTASVLWSEGHGMAARVANSTITGMDNQTLEPGSAIIMSEVEYPYALPIGIVSESDILMAHRSYRRSRMVDPIARVS